MRLIDAVNLVLPKLGEHPVTNLDISHPTLGIILPEMEETRQELLLEGWWFNEFEYTAFPDPEGFIDIGTETLSFIPHKEPAILRDGRLYNADTRSYVWDTEVVGLVKEDVPFESLPETAARCILYTATVAAVATDIGMTNEVQLWASRAQDARGALIAEHLRHRKYSTRGTRRFQRLRKALRGS